jgi:Transposase IS116/IS110/IS902 family
LADAIVRNLALSLLVEGASDGEQTSPKWRTKYFHLRSAAADRPSEMGAAFHKGRDFAVWLGLVPGQWSTGGKTKLLGISKRGNPYLRKMFIHAARALVLRSKREGSYLGQWMKVWKADLLVTQ